MVVLVLVVLGLGFGSFINALVWRIHEQAKKGVGHAKELSILSGRSMCPRCKHRLGFFDLIPIVSWIALRGRCRYCHKAISIQYPLIEVITPVLFIASYVWWPMGLHGIQIAFFVIWLAILIGLIALAVYDSKWQLLPNRIIYPLSAVAALYAIIHIVANPRPLTALVDTILSVLIGGGIFYVLFQVSGGKWIGGGDVKLGWLLGLIAGTAGRSLLLLFLAAILGTLFSLPLLMTKRLSKNSKIPFGPFLIVAIVVVELFGAGILAWYNRIFIHI